MNWKPNSLVLLAWLISFCGAQIPCTRDSGDVPPPKFTITDTKCCLEWESKNWNNHDAYLDWQMELLPHNPKIKRQRLVPSDDDSNLEEDLCFNIPSIPYQKYDLKLSCSYTDRLEPWTDDYYPLTFSTPPAVPFHPPKFVPNGFFHDPLKRQLSVLWVPLDELQFNGPNFSYVVTTDTGKSALLLSNNSAVFHDWDATRSFIVSVWSQNSLGPSKECTQLKVPILTQDRSHQPQELRYHEDNFTISWQAPQNQEGLIGYVVSWCSAPKNSSQICDDHYPIYYKELEPSKQQLTFVMPTRLHNVAVSAKYKDSFLGGKPLVVPKSVRSTNETYNLWLGFVRNRIQTP